MLVCKRDKAYEEADDAAAAGKNHDFGSVGNNEGLWRAWKGTQIVKGALQAVSSSGSTKGYYEQCRCVLVTKQVSKPFILTAVLIQPEGRHMLLN